MTNKRRLGRIRLREDPASEPPVGALGFDPLTSMPTSRRFVKLLRQRKGNLKGLLLNQSFAAGVGKLDRGRGPPSGRDRPAPGRRDAVGGRSGPDRAVPSASVVRRAVKVNADHSRFRGTGCFTNGGGSPRELGLATAPPSVSSPWQGEALPGCPPTSVRDERVTARRFLVHGRVQGVGFRYFTREVAQALGLTGWVRNLPGGEVEVWAEGPDDAVQSLAEKLGQGPRMSRVSRVDVEEHPPRGEYRSFDVTF